MQAVPCRASPLTMASHSDSILHCLFSSCTRLTAQSLLFAIVCRSGDGEAEWDAVHELVFNHANPSSDRLLRDLAGQAGQNIKGIIKWKQVQYKKCSSSLVSSQNSKSASTKQTGRSFVPVPFRLGPRTSCILRQ